MMVNLAEQCIELAVNGAWKDDGVGSLKTAGYCLERNLCRISCVSPVTGATIVGVEYNSEHVYDATVLDKFDFAGDFTGEQDVRTNVYRPGPWEKIMDSLYALR